MLASLGDYRFWQKLAKTPIDAAAPVPKNVFEVIVKGVETGHLGFAGDEGLVFHFATLDLGIACKSKVCHLRKGRTGEMEGIASILKGGGENRQAV